MTIYMAWSYDINNNNTKVSRYMVTGDEKELLEKCNKFDFELVAVLQIVFSDNVASRSEAFRELIEYARNI